VLLTVTVVLPVKVPTVAVTMIAVPVGAEPADSVVVAVPVAPVVAVVGATLPAELEKVTVAPFTGLLFESLTTAEIVAVPAAATVEALDVTVTAAALPVPVLVPVPTNALSSLPPQAVNPIARPSRTIVETNFRM
jgi:hypothetical protein